MNENEAPIGLDGLANRVRQDLARIAHPAAPWLTPREAPDGSEALDVAIVGGGQSGLATAFGLMRSKVDNILVLDRAPRDLEGPWRTYARMHTLRSPKEFTGPDLDIPSLTYQSWHEARFGKAAWQALDLIPKELWADYLLWYREVLGIPVRNEVEVVDIAPAADLLALTTRDASGGTATIHARKVVLATGQDGMGSWSIPKPLDALPRTLCVNASEAIDFEALAGKTVVVIGAGATAFDNAAAALEAGAGEVRLLCRRFEPQLVQPYRWLTFRGFLRHLSDLDDVWRWRFMNRILSMREAFPQHTYDRCARHPNFRMTTGAPVTGVAVAGDRAALTTPAGPFEADLVIVGTGIAMNFAARPELARCHDNIATWADRYTPPDDEENARLGAFPYLAGDYSFEERVAGHTPWISDIHLFSIAATMSFGASGSSINAMTTAVPKLVHGLTRGLFRDDVEAHWASLLGYDVPQAVIADAAA